MIRRVEYYICDRCGAVINPNCFYYFPFRRKKVFDIHTNAPKINAYMNGNVETLLDGKVAIEITEGYSPDFKDYHLCYKCHEEFKRFMSNEQ